MSAVEGQGIVLDVAVLGEKNRLITLFALEQGVVRGVLRGLKKNPVQPMDGVNFSHFKRLDAQLGTLEVEVCASRAAWWMADFGDLNLFVINWLREILREVLPEGAAYPYLWVDIDRFLNETGVQNQWWLLAELELKLLKTIGYGMALCEDPVVASGGLQGRLAYVSPKTGRAVDETMGRPYADRLLPLPELWGGPPTASPFEEARNAFAVTGIFLRNAVHGKRLVSRARMVEAVLERLQKEGR